MSIATLLSQHHHVTAVDIIPEKVEMINNRKSPIQDDYIEKYLAEKDLDLTATLDAKAAYSNADFVVIAAPTNYDSHTQHFDTSAVEAVIKLVMEYNPNAIMDYEKLYKAYYLQVYSYTISLAKNREIAEEITQNTFYKAVSTTSQFKGKSDELTWLCSIAKNLYHDEMRSRQRVADVSAPDEQHPKPCRRNHPERTDLYLRRCLR